ncbi:MAG: tRNA pseudouridine(55) synthase TruB [Candidatus Saganbacteria bacterium]|nr:tRNA pseudouridine(55) synthase TruB [Candidatus Saganbacteria bacterium]
MVNKPSGWTSFDVVAKIRGLSKVKKVGHSGTLDPMATGVLPVFLGSATKTIQSFLDGDKGYIAEMTLGITTDTLDKEGKILTQKPVMGIDAEKIKEALKKYRGEIEQIPPMYSAVKIKGRKLYELARKGIEIERKPRKITIHKLELLDFKDDPDHPKATIEITCSKGTYIRQLISDIGADLGCGAYQSVLTRTYAHPFRLSQAIDMDTIITLATVDKLDTIIIKPAELKS